VLHALVEIKRDDRVGAVLGRVGEALKLAFDALARGDVLHDERDTDDQIASANRRQRRADIKDAAIPAHGLTLDADRLTGEHVVKQAVGDRGGCKHLMRRSDGLFGRIAEHALGCRVPGLDHPPARSTRRSHPHRTRRSPPAALVRPRLAFAW
jgi:hypothetical protein